MQTSLRQERNRCSREKFTIAFNAPLILKPVIEILGILRKMRLMSLGDYTGMGRAYQCQLM